MKKVKVNEDLCIACGACMSVAPDLFKFNEKGFSEAKKPVVNDDNKDAINGMEACPTGAIVLEDEGNCDCEECKCEHCECHNEN